MRAFVLALLFASSNACAQSGDTAMSTGTKPQGFPVTIVETPEQAVQSANREKQTDDHDAADLDAQVRAANAAERAATATEKQIAPAYLQTAFSFLGMALLLATVVYTIRATNAAVRAAKAAADANQDARMHFALEQRPWLALGRPRLSAGYVEGEWQVYFTVTAENIGKTPASQVEMQIDVSLSQFPTANVVGVKRLAEEFSVPSTWESNQRLIFPSMDRDLWDFSIAETDRTVSRPFLVMRYCVRYRGEGIEKVLATAGEVIISLARIQPLGPAGELSDIDAYLYYGVSFAT